MKFKSFFILTLLLRNWAVFAEEEPSGIIYLYPSPGSKYVSVQSSIIMKFDKKITSRINYNSIQILVDGIKSGIHDGKIIISDNSVLFDPESNFETSEKVNVTLKSNLINRGKEYSFSFETNSIRNYNLDILNSVSDDLKENLLAKGSNPGVYGKTTLINGVAVPSDFPKINVAVSNDPANGKIFIANWGGTSYMMILENDGTPYFYKRFPGSDQTRDFKVQPTGTLTRRVYENLNCFVEMDSQYINIDTLRCKNGYGTDEHECIMLPDHHFFLIGLDYRTVDMSKIVSGGKTNATVIGNHVQELDENHNVVFEWRSWDHFNIADAVHENLTNNSIDYVHMNSIAIDYDSNIVISSRHLSEITKINRKTGEIIWRFGGVNNQFTLVDDVYGISYQHDCRPVSGKPDHYTIFDNGNFRNFTRVVEFKIDTSTMTATKVWEYRHIPDYYTYWMGNAQRLPNGNTFIDWADYSLPKAFEVTPSKEIIYQANFEQSVPCYRAYRFDWESVVKVPYLIAESYSDKVTLIFNKFGDKKVEKYIIYSGFYPHPTTPLDSTSNTFIDLTNLTNNGRYFFRVTARDSSGIESSFSNEESVVVNFIPAGENFIVNGDFSDGTNNWVLNFQNDGHASGSVIDSEYCIFNIDNPGSNYFDIQLIQESFPLINGKKYVFEFDARADANRVMEPRVAQKGGNYTVYSKTGAVLIGSTPKHFKYEFEMTDPTDYSARVVLNFGTSNVKCYIDNVSVKEVLPNSIENNTSAPGDFILYQNYPNPFNPSTNITYQLSGTGKKYSVSLIVFDVLGKKVAELENGQKSSGKYTVQWNASRQSSGVYYGQLKVFDPAGIKVFNAVKKILLLK